MKAIIAALFTLFVISTPLLADEAKVCATLDQVKEVNAGINVDYLPLPDEKFQILKKNVAALHHPLPDSAASIVVGQTAKAEGIAFLFFFDKDGCLDGVGKVPVGILNSYLKDIPTT